MKQTLVLLLILCSIFHSPWKIQAQENRPNSTGPNTGNVKHQVGENFGGGKIFWMDETGQHGLIAAPSDQSAKGIAWNSGKPGVTAASKDQVYAGMENSEKILSVQGTGSQYAARLCLDYSTTSGNVVYNDWYLPSKFELNTLYQQRLVIGGFNLASGIYWSSTESTTEPATSAWEQEFKFGSQHEDDKDMPDQVRCIRKF